MSVQQTESCVVIPGDDDIKKFSNVYHIDRSIQDPEGSYTFRLIPVLGQEGWDRFLEKEVKYFSFIRNFSQDQYNEVFANFFGESLCGQRIRLEFGMPESVDTSITIPDIYMVNELTESRIWRRDQKLPPDFLTVMGIKPFPYTNLDETPGRAIYEIKMLFSQNSPSSIEFGSLTVALDRLPKNVELTPDRNAPFLLLREFSLLEE
tara:strand:+ start:4716 stop:5333 length:618 start_codon:yes stop_codon:yes gene_type:complete